MKNNELEFLREKCLLFNQFMMEKVAPIQMHEFYKESNKLIEKAFKSQNLKPLQVMSKEIDRDILKHMPLPMAVEFKKFVSDKINIDFDAINKAHGKFIERLLKRGKISNEEEYRLILDRIDDIYSNKDNTDEVKQLNKLLIDFQKVSNTHNNSK